MGATPEHHRTRVLVHHQPSVLRAASDEHSQSSRHDQRHHRRSRRHVQPQRCARCAHRRKGVRPRAGDRRQPRVRGLGRRWRESAVDHPLQRHLLRLLPRRHPHRARAVHLPLPDGTRGHAELPVDRQQVPERLTRRDLDSHVVQRHVRHGFLLRQQGRAELSRRRAEHSPDHSGHGRVRRRPRAPHRHAAAVGARFGRVRGRELPDHQPARRSRRARALRRELLDGEEQGRSWDRSGGGGAATGRTAGHPSGSTDAGRS